MNERFLALDRGALFTREIVHIPAISIDNEVAENTAVRPTWRSFSDADLRTCLLDEAQALNRQTLIVIPQEYSWGHLMASETIFARIMEHFDIPPAFLSIVAAYGLKRSEDERVFYGVNTSCVHQSCVSAIHDLFYNIPYVAKQEGKTVESWVIRQTGIYHQRRNKSSASRWLMLNLREPKKRLFREIFVAPLHCCIVSMHVQLQVIISSDWTSYVEHLTAKLHALSNKGYYSGFDPNGCEGFSVTNQDVQHLAMFRARIERAMYASESCIDIAEACRVHFQRHAEHSLSRNMACVRCLDLLQKHQHDMVQHRRSLSRLDQRLNMTLDLISKVLMLRSEKVLQAAVEQNRDASKALVDVSRQIKDHQETLAQTFSLVQADSVLLKLLAMVATLCLPASLVATVFSSNLVQSVQDTQQPVRLALSPQFWVYIVVSVPLMIFILAWMIHLDRKSQKHAAKAAVTI